MCHTNTCLPPVLSSASTTARHSLHLPSRAKRAMAEHHTHLVSRGVKRQREAPQDMENCGIGCYIWGTQLPIIVDILVLGHSLKEQGNKAKRYLCIHGDTHSLKMSMLFKAFWELVPVSHVKLPQHLQGSELNRLQGVYSKLQTVKIFAERPYALKRFLLLDGDMLVRSNIDDIFSTNVPAAVIRGPADTCLYNRRPSHTYFKQGMESSFTRGGQKMKGGMNGGLVLFEPKVSLYEDMYSKLKNSSRSRIWQSRSSSVGFLVVKEIGTPSTRRTTSRSIRCTCARRRRHQGSSLTAPTSI